MKEPTVHYAEGRPATEFTEFECWDKHMGWAKATFDELERLGEADLAARIEAIAQGKRGKHEWAELELKTWNDNDNDFAFAELGRAVAGFANANGGLLIYGFSKGDNSRLAASPCSQAQVAQSGLTHKLKECTEPAVPDTQPLIAAIPDHPDKCYVVVFVARSDTGPHMAKFGKYSGKFFRRRTDKTSQMSQREIGEMFGRSPQPVLRPEIVAKWKNGSLQVAIDIHNCGLGMARWATVECRCRPQGAMQDLAFLFESRQTIGKHLDSSTRPYYCFSAIPANESEGIVHAGQTRRVIDLTFRVVAASQDDIHIGLTIMAQGMGRWTDSIDIENAIFMRELLHHAFDAKQSGRKLLASYRRHHELGLPLCKMFQVSEGSLSGAYQD